MRYTERVFPKEGEIVYGENEYRRGAHEMRRRAIRRHILVVLVVVASSLFLTAEFGSAQQSYPIVCRGGGSLHLAIIPAYRHTIQAVFVRGTEGARSGGLAPGSCTWVDRAIGVGEPNRLCHEMAPGALRILSWFAQGRRIDKMEFENERDLEYLKALESPFNYRMFHAYNDGTCLLVTRVGP